MVHVGHADEAPTPQARLATRMVAAAQLADDGRVADVELVAVLEHLYVSQPEGIAAFHAKLKHEPIGQVHQIFVQDGMSAENRRLAVVDAVDVRARVVHAVGTFPFRSAARAQVPVARRGQGLSQALVLWVESLIGQPEAVHRISRIGGRSRDS